MNWYELQKSLEAGINVNSFAGGAAGGGIPSEALLDLNKAMLSGDLWRVVNQMIRIQREQKFQKAIATSAFGGYSGMEALRVEDLSAIMTRQVHDAETVPFYRRLTKTPADNILVQYDRLTALGQINNGFPFFQEGSLPRGDDSRWERKTDLVKCAGTLRAITHMATQVKTGAGVTNARATENENGVAYLLQNLEMSLYWAQASCSIMGGSPLAYDGLIPSIVASSPASNIIDLHGQSLTCQNVRDAALIIKEIGKFPFAKNALGVAQNIGVFCSPTQSQALSDEQGPFARWNMSTMPQGLVPGAVVNAVQSQFGLVEIVDDVWLNEWRRPNVYAPAAANGSAPDAPTSVAIAAVPATVTGSNWQSTDAGTIFYAVTGFGPNGETAAVAATPTSVTAVTNGAVDITITPPPGNTPIAYYIWRGRTAATMEQVAMIPPGAVAGAFTWRDLNYWMPGTTCAVAGVWAPQAVDIAELTPFFSLNLGVMSTEFRWLVLNYLTFRFRNPIQFVLFRNAARV